MGRRAKRSWNEATKKMIVAESNVQGVSAASVARRYKISAQQLALWRRDPKLNEANEASGFYPVEVTPDTDTTILPSHAPHILFACGTKIICPDEAALVLAVRAMRQAS